MLKSCTLVIAARNSANMLKVVVPENLKAGFQEVIVIDGESTDGSCEVLRDLERLAPGRIRFVCAAPRGLAHARNLGTAQVNTEYVVHSGPDNIITQETLDVMLGSLQSHDLVSCQTRLLNEKTFLDKAHNIYKKRFFPGPRNVVGTPYVAKTALMREFPFDDKMLNSDDAELCERLRASGKSVFRSPGICYETGFNDLPSIIERWTRWGRGDALFYAKFSRDWSFPRKVRSWLRPILAEFFEPFHALSLVEFVFVSPFLMFVCALRYYGWLRYLLLRK